MNLEELRQELKKLDLPSSGTKSQLIDRLLIFNKTKEELKQELSKRGLKVSGSKKELVRRILSGDKIQNERNKENKSVRKSSSRAKQSPSKLKNSLEIVKKISKNNPFDFNHFMLTGKTVSRNTLESLTEILPMLKNKDAILVELRLHLTEENGNMKVGIFTGVEDLDKVILSKLHNNYNQLQNFLRNINVFFPDFQDSKLYWMDMEAPQGPKFYHVLYVKNINKYKNFTDDVKGTLNTYLETPDVLDLFESDINLNNQNILYLSDKLAYRNIKPIITSLEINGLKNREQYDKIYFGYGSEIKLRVRLNNVYAINQRTISYINNFIIPKTIVYSSK
jgi:hypothetical protein